MRDLFGEATIARRVASNLACVGRLKRFRLELIERLRRGETALRHVETALRRVKTAQRHIVLVYGQLGEVSKMKICLLLGLAVVMSCMDGLSGEREKSQVQITFQLHCSEVPKDSQVFITGNLAVLGKWRPNAVPMKLADNGTWSFQISVPRGTLIEYKYTLGDWSKEGAGVRGQPLSNFKLTATDSVTQKDEVKAWTNGARRVFHGQVTGNVQYHRQIESRDLRPRDVVVWLPPSYESETDRHYPVLYMHDGQNLFDPRTSAFGIDWQVDETITKMVRKEQLEPIIVVGICNTPDRSREYTEGDKGVRYRNFVVSELKPLIDAKYRTKPEREHTFVAGSSAGGLCAFIMAWEHAETFAGALCMSPAFRFQREDGSFSIDYVSRVRSTSRPKPSLRIYIDNGGGGVDEKLMPGVNAMIEALRSKGFVENIDLRVVIAPQDLHNESAWARRFPAAIQSVFD